MAVLQPKEYSTASAGIVLSPSEHHRRKQCNTETRCASKKTYVMSRILIHFRKSEHSTS